MNKRPLNKMLATVVERKPSVQASHQYKHIMMVLNKDNADSLKGVVYYNPKEYKLNYNSMGGSYVDAKYADYGLCDAGGCSCRNILEPDSCIFDQSFCIKIVPANRLK